MLSLSDVKPLHLADVSFPEGHPRAGETGPVFAFAVLHPQGPLLIDTGIGGDSPEIERWYRPVRTPLSEALAAVGLRPDDITAVVNSHLHFDHCGENRLFPGRPIYVQAREYEAAHGSLYTIPDWVDFPGARYELLDSEADLLPGVRAVPTPGHTAGHQSVVIGTAEGLAIVAAQAAETAGEFAQAIRERRTTADDAVRSLRRLHALKPRAVYFSHDARVWESETDGEQTR
ncbi:MAG: N-acyl homoserine lactonase family protein [Chloroflexi bacterium]|nr:N-acyl homoserine lactonase family protein [Chloroflexota bacterium]